MRSAAAEVHCECGKWSGEYCSWSGPRSQTVLVEYMPQHLRTLHDDAGDLGIYPHNGAIRVRVERSCCDRMVKHDGEWVSVSQVRSVTN